MFKKSILIYFLFIIPYCNTLGQVDTLKIKTDSVFYTLAKNSSLNLLLYVDNISNQKIEIKGLENLRIDSLLMVLPYAETYFSKYNVDFKEYGCKVDHDPIAWNFRKYTNNKFILKVEVPADCLSLIGYFKIQLHLYYQVVSTGQNRAAASNWFIVKVNQ